MKAILFAVFAMMFLTAPQFAPKVESIRTPSSVKEATCKIETNDIGKIVGRGPSSDKAFEDAATQCFDRRTQLYRMLKGKAVDEDSGLVIIDTCANIKCES